MSDRVELSLDVLLTTTRAIRRRMDFDRPVLLEVITDCVRIAVQALRARTVRAGIGS